MVQCVSQYSTNKRGVMASTSTQEKAGTVAPWFWQGKLETETKRGKWYSGAMAPMAVP